MLVSQMMIFHYLNSICHSYHIEYPLASYEKRMPRLPSPNDITEFLDNFVLHRPNSHKQNSHPQKPKGDSKVAKRSFFKQLKTIFSQEEIWKSNFLIRSNHSIRMFPVFGIRIQPSAIYEYCTIICVILRKYWRKIFIYFFAINKRVTSRLKHLNTPNLINIVSTKGVLADFWGWKNCLAATEDGLHPFFKMLNALSVNETALNS